MAERPEQLPLTLQPPMVVFAHAVNNPELLEKALADAEAGRINFIEADVILGPDGASAAMGHDPGHYQAGTVGVFPFASFVEVLEKRGQGKIGLKVDIKQREAVAHVLRVVRQAEKARMDDGLPSLFPLLELSSGPKATFSVSALMVNADVLTGPRTSLQAGCRFNSKGRVLPVEEQIEEAKQFIEEVGTALPSAILSLGWTTAHGGATIEAGRAIYDERGGVMSVSGNRGFVCYTETMVEAMLKVTASFPGVHYTWPLKASYVPHSWPALKVLMDHHLSSTITLWAHEPATALEARFFADCLPQGRVMVDLPPAAVTKKSLSTSKTATLIGAAVAGAAVSVGALLLFSLFAASRRNAGNR